MKEVWKKINGFEVYEISNLGRIRRGNKIGTPTLSNKQYLAFDLKIRFRKTCKIHRLVAEMFIPNPENKPQVNHKDGNKLNNNLDNLEWVTASENSKHAYRIGLIKPQKGEGNANSKLTEENVKFIRGSILNNKQLGCIFNVSHSNISAIRLYKSWK